MQLLEAPPDRERQLPLSPGLCQLPDLSGILYRTHIITKALWGPVSTEQVLPDTASSSKLDAAWSVRKRM